MKDEETQVRKEEQKMGTRLQTTVSERSLLTTRMVEDAPGLGLKGRAKEIGGRGEPVERTSDGRRPALLAQMAMTMETAPRR
jgi:hypothetical protein